ncbi:hypothetical protein HK096_000808, partial [Nowakowskiella sp. JEL0078]
MPLNSLPPLPSPIDDFFSFSVFKIYKCNFPSISPDDYQNVHSFCSHLVSTFVVSETNALSAIKYINLFFINNKTFHQSDLSALIVVALAVANKINDDSPYSLLSWSTHSKILLSKLSKFEWLLLDSLDFGIGNTFEDLKYWSSTIRVWLDERISLNSIVESTVVADRVLDSLVIDQSLKNARSPMRGDFILGFLIFFIYLVVFFNKGSGLNYAVLQVSGPPQFNFVATPFEGEEDAISRARREARERKEMKRATLSKRLMKTDSGYSSAVDMFSNDYFVMNQNGQFNDIHRSNEVDPFYNGFVGGNFSTKMNDWQVRRDWNTTVN